MRCYLPWIILLNKCYVKNKLWPYGQNHTVFDVGIVDNHAIEKAQQLDSKPLENYH